MDQLFWALSFSALAGAGAAQTMIDLRTQSKSVDHSGAQATKPFKSGSNLPAICSTGEFFYRTTGQPGRNLYACVATNTWTLYSGASDLSTLGDI